MSLAAILENNGFSENLESLHPSLYPYCSCLAAEFLRHRSRPCVSSFNAGKPLADLSEFCRYRIMPPAVFGFF